MYLKSISFFILIFLSLSFSAHKDLHKRIDKEIKSTFNVERYTYDKIVVSKDIAEELPSKFSESNFLKITSNNTLLGYVYMSKAPSKTAQFDYLVILDKNLIVAKTKVTAYREEYGGEIGSKRWLKQFIGKKGGDELKHGDNIVAISGATISVRSMTNAINDFLKSLKIIQSKNIL